MKYSVASLAHSQCEDYTITYYTIGELPSPKTLVILVDSYQYIATWLNTFAYDSNTNVLVIPIEDNHSIPQHDLPHVLDKWLSIVGIASYVVCGADVAAHIAIAMARYYTSARGLILLPTNIITKPRSWISTLLAITTVRDRDQSAQSQVLLAHVPVKTMIIWGASDVVTPLSIARSLQSLQPRSQLIVLPNSGHTILIDSPDDTYAIISEFLKLVV